MKITIEVQYIYLECNTIEYDFKISANKFPGKIYAKYLRNNSKIKSKYPNEYDIKLDLRFKRNSCFI